MNPKIYHDLSGRETSPNELASSEAVKKSIQNAINTCKNDSDTVCNNLKDSEFGKKLQPVIENGVIKYNGRIFELPPGGASVSLAKDGSGLLRCKDKNGDYLPTPTEIKNNESGIPIPSVASLGSYDGRAKVNTVSVPPVSKGSENINSLKDPRNLDSAKYFVVYDKFNNDSDGRKLLAQLNTTGIPFTQMGSQEKRDYLIAVLLSVPKTNVPNLKKITQELGYRTT